MSRMTLETGQTVYDPRGAIDTQPQELAPRPESLRDRRVGVLDNSKWNAGALLRHVVEMLEEEVGPFGAVTTYKKDSFSSNAAPELIGRIAAKEDVVITAIGD